MILTFTNKYVRNGCRYFLGRVQVFYRNFEFKTRVIGLNYPKSAKDGLEWLPYSPDLNPLDFIFWSYLKDKVYKNNPKTLSELKNAIIVEINHIDVQVLQCVIQNFCKRLELCQESDGSHFKHIYL